MLELEDVQLAPGDDTRFCHVFRAGEISVVLGANRAGKTDLCRLIAGLPTVATGRLALDGERLDGVPPQKRPVGLVYQAFVNYPNLTVHDNIASPLRARGLARPDLATRVHDIAAALQLSELLNRLPHELSGGQQQRVAIARALAKEARVLVLDEPLVNLDFKLREALQVELRDLLHAANTVVIYTSSDPRDAFALGDQLLLLAGGRSVQSGSPIDVYRQPASLAAMELLADPGVNRFTRDGNVAAIRPEHLSLEAPVDAADALQFDMRVTALETSGNETFIHGRVDDADWVARCQGMRDVRTGTDIVLHVRRDEVQDF
jgi:glycerol transport system ATP-binding protein